MDADEGECVGGWRFESFVVLVLVLES